MITSNMLKHNCCYINHMLRLHYDMTAPPHPRHLHAMNKTGPPGSSQREVRGIALLFGMARLGLVIHVR